MEAKMGSLQAVIDQAGARVAKGEAMKEKDVGLAASLKVCKSKPVVTFIQGERHLGGV